MRNAFRIFRRDMKRLLRSPAAVLVMIGVCIIPSLYAWFNIAANIDPYSNTSGIKVAVANNDKDATSNDLTINAGNEIIKNLKENDQLGWTFTNEENAVEGVKSGKYYAAIVIPEDFSSSLLSILSGKMETPKLDYYLNEKINAIAPKITDSGASTIQLQINNTFSSIASESVSNVLKQSVTDLAGTIDTVNSDLVSMLDKVNDNIAEYQKILDSFNSSVGGTQTLIDNAKSATSALGDAATSGANALSDADSVLKETRTATGDFTSALSQSISNGLSIIEQAYGQASEGFGKLSGQASDINQKVGNALNNAQEVNTRNGEIIATLQQLASQLPAQSDTINSALAKLSEQNQSNQQLISSLTAGNDGISNALSTTTNTLAQLETINKANLSGIQSLRTSLDENVFPQLNQTMDIFSSLTGELNGILNGVPATTEQLNSILTQLGTSLTELNNVLNGTQSSLNAVINRLDNVRTDINAITSSETFQKLTSLEGIDSDTIAEFVSSPVNVDTETYYSVKNYGSSMTPFYSNLAIWVGGIVLIAIFKMEVDRDRSMRSYSATNMYFGRWLLYMLLGLVQGLIVCVGDVFLPGVQCRHPFALVLTGLVCSFVYVNIIYALSLTFKHIGKALCVIFVILQIPGSSGTYPIEMTPVFFQKIHPLLPFTYGVAAMREAIAGMYGSVYIHNLLTLLCYVPIALLIGLGIRPLLAGLNRLFDLKLSETEFMVCEEPDEQLSRSAQLSMLLKASLSQDDLRTQTAEKAQNFEQNYRKMIRYGFLAIIIIPLIFLILMFSLESKIVFLVLWIISIIAIATWLIIVEFIHTRLAEQQQLAGMSFDEMVKRFHGKEEE